MLRSYRILCGFFVALPFASMSCTDLSDSAISSEAPSIDYGKPIIEQCFTVLLAGELMAGDRLSSVTLATGPCQGESKAITDFVEVSEVVVRTGDQTFRSSLYLAGTHVIARNGSRQFPIATLDASASGPELVVVPQFQLTVSGVDQSRELVFSQRR